MLDAGCVTAGWPLNWSAGASRWWAWISSRPCWSAARRKGPDVEWIEDDLADATVADDRGRWRALTRW